MIDVDEEGHRLPPCDVHGCDRKAVAAASGERASELPQVEPRAGDGRVVLCIDHFEHLIGQRSRR